MPIGKNEKSQRDKDKGDFAALLEMAEAEGVFENGAMGAKAPKVLKAYVDLIRAQIKKEREEVQKFITLALMNFSVYVAEPKELIRQAKEELLNKKAAVDCIGEKMEELRDAKKTREFIKKFKKE